MSTEKGLSQFLTALKGLKTQKELYHCLTTPKVFITEKGHHHCLKVGLSPSKNICVICFIESLLKIMKNAFLFNLKSSIRSQDI